MSSAVPTLCNACGQEIDMAFGAISINGLRGLYHESCITKKNATPMAMRIAELEAALRDVVSAYDDIDPVKRMREAVEAARALVK